MTQVLDFNNLRSAEKNRNVADYAKYGDLLRDLGKGKKPKDAEIMAILQRNDKTVADLEMDVQWRQKRDEQIAEARLEPQYRAEKAEAEVALDKLSAEFNKVREKYEVDCRPHQAKIDQLREKLHWTMVYRMELQKDHRDPNLLAELDILHSQRSGQRIPYLEEQVESIERQIMFAQQELDGMPTLGHNRTEKGREIRSKIKELQARLEPIRTEIGALERKDAEIDKAVSDVYERMIFA